jgi:hypothetical protein
LSRHLKLKLRAACVLRILERQGNNRMSDQRLSTERIALIEQFRALSDLSPSLQSLQQNIVEAMAQRLPHFSWTFSPSRRQMRSTRSLLTCQPALCNSTAIRR